MPRPFYPRSRPVGGSVPQPVRPGIAPARTGTALMQQIRAARYGATGLGSGGYSTVAGPRGVGTEPYGMSAPATNPATLRALARGHGSDAGWARDELEKRRRAQMRSLDDRVEAKKRFTEARINRLLDMGRVDEAMRLWERMNRMLSVLLRPTGPREGPSEEGYDLLPWK